MPATDQSAASEDRESAASEDRERGAARKPLNGEKTHPLTEHALGMLGDLAVRSVPASLVNPGVVNRLIRESLVEIVQAPSPFKTSRGRVISHLRITDAGRAALALARAAAEG